MARLDAATGAQIFGDTFFLVGGAFSHAAGAAAGLGLLLPRVRGKTVCLWVAWLSLVLAVIWVGVVGPLSNALV